MFGNKITIREKAVNCQEDDEMTKKKRCIPVSCLKHILFEIKWVRENMVIIRGNLAKKIRKKYGKNTEWKIMHSE